MTAASDKDDEHAEKEREHEGESQTTPVHEANGQEDLEAGERGRSVAGADGANGNGKAD